MAHAERSESAEYRRHRSFADRLYRDDAHFEQKHQGMRKDLARSVAGLLKSWVHQQARVAGQKNPEQFFLSGGFKRVRDLIHAGFYTYLPYVLHPTQYADPTQSRLHEWDLGRINGILLSNPRRSLEVRGWGSQRVQDVILNLGRQKDPQISDHAVFTARRVAQMDLALRKTVNSQVERDELAERIAGTSRLEQPEIHTPAELESMRQKEHQRAQEGLAFLRNEFFPDPSIRLLMAAKNFVDLQHEGYASEKEVRYLALSAMQYHAPFLMQVGLADAADQLNEMAFAALHPNEHGRIKDYMERHAPEIDRKLSVLESFYANELAPHYEFEITRRRKSVFRIWRKLFEKPHYSGPEELGDLGGLRIVLSRNKKHRKGVVTAADCRTALQLLHDASKQMVEADPSLASELGRLEIDPEHPRFKDYLSKPRYIDPAKGQDSVDGQESPASDSVPDAVKKKEWIKYRSLHAPVFFYLPSDAELASALPKKDVPTPQPPRPAWKDRLARHLPNLYPFAVEMWRPVGRFLGTLKHGLGFPPRPRTPTQRPSHGDVASLLRLEQLLPPEIDTVELQVRTKAMDEEAERGAASHLEYEGHKKEPSLEPLHTLFFGPMNNPATKVRLTLHNKTDPQPVEPMVHLDVSASVPVIDVLARHSEIAQLLPQRHLTVERLVDPTADPETGKKEPLDYDSRFRPNDVLFVSKAYPERIPSEEERQYWRHLAFHHRTKAALVLPATTKRRKR